MRKSFVRCVSSGVACLLLHAARSAQTPASAAPRHNVILFVADGLRHDAVTPETMPTFWKVRTTGVDFRNSHSVFPTFTTANASAIATGHGLGDTGDYANSIYPGVWLTKPHDAAAKGGIVPFLENDETLANMNAVFAGNYLGERTLLSFAREKGYNVASVGKLGPTAIQQNDAVGWAQTGALTTNGAIIVDDATGGKAGLPLPTELLDAMTKAGLAVAAPSRSNGFGDESQGNNGFSGDAATPGTKASNHTQEQWFADVSTKVLLPKFTAEGKPFMLLFWSRDPDGSQHNEGDSLQTLTPGINGETSKRGLADADHCLKQLLDWLDAHPAVKAATDVVLTSDHGFATISRRELSAGVKTGAPSSTIAYASDEKEADGPKGPLPAGFRAVDLSLGLRMRLFDPDQKAASGDSVYTELRVGGTTSRHPLEGSGLLGDPVKQKDGSDAKLLVVANGASDLIYAPGKDAELVRETVRVLAGLDYVGGIFVNEAFCPTASDCPAALPLSAIGLVGKSKVPRPAIVVSYKVFYQTPGNLLSAAQISDTTLQEGQGMHGGFGREQTFNNMEAIGPDFKEKFVDYEPVGNVDLVPTLARIMGLEMPKVGTLVGRSMGEALVGGQLRTVTKGKRLVSAPASNGLSTVLEYQEEDGVRYYDRACLVSADAARKCN